VGHSAGEETESFHFLGLLQKLLGSSEGNLGDYLFVMGTTDHDRQDPPQGHEHDLV
jgi:hypothetical protein